MSVLKPAASAESRIQVVRNIVRRHPVIAVIAAAMLLVMALTSLNGFLVILFALLAVTIVLRRREPSSLAERKGLDADVTAPATWGVALHLGGDLAVGLEPLKHYAVAFGQQGVTVWELHRPSADPQEQAAALPVWQISWSKITWCEASGRGREASGGGFMGGGFGVEGAAAGMAAASLLNAVSTRTTVDSNLLIETSEGEKYWQFIQETPDQVSRWLAPWRSLQRKKINGTSGGSLSSQPGQSLAETPDALEALTRLRDLRDDGTIDEQEFQSMKKRIITAWRSEDWRS